MAGKYQFQEHREPAVGPGGDIVEAARFHVQLAGGELTFDHAPTDAEIDATLPVLDRALAAINGRLDAIETRMAKLDSIEAKVAAIDAKVPSKEPGVAKP